MESGKRGGPAGEPADRPVNGPATDAHVASLHAYARVNMAFIAARMLGDAVYLDPATMAWRSADEYLSGNLREKRNVAVTLSKRDKRLLRNVAALEEAMPARFARFPFVRLRD